MTDLAAHDMSSREPTLTEQVLDELRAAFADDVSPDDVTPLFEQDIENAENAFVGNKTSHGITDELGVDPALERDVESAFDSFLGRSADRDFTAETGAPSIDRSPRLASRFFGSKVGGAVVAGAVATICTAFIGNGRDASASQETEALKLSKPVATQLGTTFDANTTAALTYSTQDLSAAARPASTTQDAELSSFAGLLDAAGDLPGRAVDVYNSFSFSAKQTDGGRVVLFVANFFLVVYSLQYGRKAYDWTRNTAGIGRRR
jgi:hypothetical protein